MKSLRSVCVSVCLVTLLPALGSAKIKVESEEDLPRFTYEVEGQLTDLVLSEQDFAAFARKVRANIESVLEEYEIEDATTLKDHYGVLLAMQMPRGLPRRAVSSAR